jgi:hypothetical protein
MGDDNGADLSGNIPGGKQQPLLEETDFTEGWLKHGDEY